MEIVIQELDHDTESHEEIGRLDGETREILSGRDNLLSIMDESEWKDREKEDLISMFNGPNVVATIVSGDDQSDMGKRIQRKVKSFLRKATADDGDETWVPYQGPRGGQGWENTQTGETIYSEYPPGPVDEAIRDEIPDEILEGEGEGGEDDSSGAESLPDEGVERRDEGHFVSADPDPERDLEEFNESEEVDKAMFTQEYDDEGNPIDPGIDEPFGGFTFQRNLDPYPVEEDDVWMVALDQDNFTPSEEDVGKEEVAQFYEKMLPVLEETPGLRIGGYRFPEGDDKISIDISVAVKDEEEAKELGEELRQDSVFNPKMALGDGDWENGSVSTYDEDQEGHGESPLDGPEDIKEFVENRVDSIAKLLTASRPDVFVMSKSDVLYYEAEDGDRLYPDQVARGMQHHSGRFESTEEGIIYEDTLYEAVQDGDSDGE